MDPNANLASQRSTVSQILTLWDHCNDNGTLTEESEIQLAHLAHRLAELVEALDGWITKGGALPAKWQATR